MDSFITYDSSLADDITKQGKIESENLKQAYHDTAMDFANNSNTEMYDYYMDKMVEVSGIPKEFHGEDKNKIEFLMLEKEESRFKKFINKLRQ